MFIKLNKLDFSSGKRIFSLLNVTISLSSYQKSDVPTGIYFNWLFPNDKCLKMSHFDILKCTVAQNVALHDMLYISFLLFPQNLIIAQSLSNINYNRFNLVFLLDLISIIAVHKTLR